MSFELTKMLCPWPFVTKPDPHKTTGRGETMSPATAVALSGYMASMPALGTEDWAMLQSQQRGSLKGMPGLDGLTSTGGLVSICFCGERPSTKHFH